MITVENLKKMDVKHSCQIFFLRKIKASFSQTPFRDLFPTNRKYLYEIIISLQTTKFIKITKFPSDYENECHFFLKD